MKMQKILYLGSLVLGLAVCQHASANGGGYGGRAPGFYPLGDFSGGAFESAALGVSGNGSIAVGFGSDGSGRAAFKWSSGSISTLPGGLGISIAEDANGSGSVIVGQGTFGSAKHAFRLSGSSVTDLGTLSALGHDESSATGVSSGGNAVVGHSSIAGNFNSLRAFSWNASSGMMSLGVDGTNSFGQAYSQANGVSSDGKRIVGFTTTDSGEEAFLWVSGTKCFGNHHRHGCGHGHDNYGNRWRQHDDDDDGGHHGGGHDDDDDDGDDSNGGCHHGIGGKMVALGVLPGVTPNTPDWVSQAMGISGNGKVVVGLSRSLNGTEAFRWTQSGNMVSLGDLPGGIVYSTANAANNDGTVIVGSGDTDNGTEAFYWSPFLGMRRLADIAAHSGITIPAGYQLFDAFDVSEDGSTISGWAVNANGDFEAYVLELPRSVADGTVHSASYWRRNPNAWCSTSISIGCTNYTRTKAINIMKDSGGKDKTFDLAEQLIAAKLNISCSWSDSSCIAAEVAAADAWLCSYPVGSNVKKNTAAWNSISAVYEQLRKYNEGKLCAPSDDDRHEDEH